MVLTRVANCQRACKRCDDTRPCVRCVKYGNEATCIDSSRKERRKGGKRGPYKTRELSRSTTEEASPSKLSSENWTPSPDRERPRRGRKRVNYREARGYAGEEGEESSGTEGSEGSQSDAVLPSKSGKSYVHSPLFKMVLSTMHGDLVVPTDHPKLFELAAVCTELYERESKQDSIVFINTLLEERRAANVTPTTFVPRDILTPPGTPIVTKPYIRPYAGAVYAPVPMQPHKKPLSAYPAYFTPSV